MPRWARGLALFLLVVVVLLCYGKGMPEDHVDAAGDPSNHTKHHPSSTSPRLEKRTLAPDVLHFRLVQGDRPVTVEQGLRGMKGGETPLMDLLTSAVQHSGYPAVFFEMPPVTLSSASDTPWEFVVVNAGKTALATVSADPSPFDEQFKAAGEEAVTDFKNLRGDAMLVVPVKQEASQQYPHLKAFLDSAPPSLQHLFWQRVA
eukprot:Sspe_Gene.97528::Locus_71101_Transcript_1_1_Confidence_1.000_Length_1298::g.97528::m.97528